MAIKQAEVKLTVVWDDDAEEGPRNWPWQTSLQIGGAKVGGNYIVTEAKVAKYQLATEDAQAKLRKATPFFREA